MNEHLTEFEQVEIPVYDVLELQDVKYLQQLRQELRDQAAVCQRRCDEITNLLVEWGFEERLKRQRRLGKAALRPWDGGDEPA